MGQQEAFPHHELGLPFQPQGAPWRVKAQQGGWQNRESDASLGINHPGAATSLHPQGRGSTLNSRLISLRISSALSTRACRPSPVPEKGHTGVGTSPIEVGSVPLPWDLGAHGPSPSGVQWKCCSGTPRLGQKRPSASPVSSGTLALWEASSHIGVHTPTCHAEEAGLGAPIPGQLAS